MANLKKKINIIDTMSKKEKSETYIVNFEGGTTFFKLIKYKDKEMKELYKCIKNIESKYIPKIIDIWDDGDSLLVLQEYVAGRTLREMIDKGNISRRNLKSYMIMLCEALKVLHENEPKIVHRDVKPENIIVTMEGNLKLIDYDIARIYKEHSEHDTALLGTRDYAAPEQFGYMQTDERSDIYSAGMVLKELYGVCSKEAGYKGYVKKVIKKATRFDPDKRYPSVCIMEKDMEELYFGRMARLVIMFAISFVFVLGTGMVAAWMSGMLTRR